MNTDFLSRFKGKTQTMSKKEGITGIIKASATPIEKMPASYTFSSYLANAIHQCNFSDVEKQSQYSNDVTPTSKDPQIITNIKSNGNRKLSIPSPSKSSNHMSKSHVEPNKQYDFPLSKTGTVNFNINDYELIAIPKRMLQFGIKLQQTDYKESREPIPLQKQPYSKSQSLDLQQDRPIIRSQILNSGSYAQKNERKKSLLLAGLSSIKH